MSVSVSFANGNHSIKIILLLMLVVTLFGCATNDFTKTASMLAGCAAGGAGGAYLGKTVGKNQNIGQKGSMIAGGLAGCFAGAAVANAIHSKLSEEGKKNRELALVEAAKSARTQRYTDPVSPDLIGTVTPGTRYAELEKNRECVDQEDVLADKQNGEKQFVKYCRVLPNGEWGPIA